jgi:type IV secretion system protein VirD4
MQPLTNSHDVTSQYSRPSTPTSGGTASFLTLLEAGQLGLTRHVDDGNPETTRPYIGAMRDVEGISGERPIYAAARAHCATFAPTRAGKGVGQILPVLFSWHHSVIVVDVKGENYRRSAGYRAKELNQSVQRFAPFEQETHRFNPIMAIPIGDSAQAEETAFFLADLTCPPNDSSGGDSGFFNHWNRKVAASVMLHVRNAPLDGKPDPLEGKELSPAERAGVRQRSMAEVSRLLSLDNPGLRALLARMKRSSFAMVRQTAVALDRLIGGTDSKTGDNVLASLAQHMDVWAMERVARATYIPGFGSEPGANEIDFAALRDGRTSIYLVVPPDEMVNWRNVLRVMVGVAVRQMRMTQKQAIGQPPVLALLDEFPQLGYMAPIEQSMLYMAGYGLLYWFFCQSLNDIERHYPKSYRTFLANTATQCFYAVSDKETADYVSELAGPTTVANFGYSRGVNGGTSTSATHSEGSNSGPGGSGNNSSTSTTDGQNTGWSQGENVSYVSRPLLMPDEVRTLGAEAELIFIRHTKPIVASLIPYYRIPHYVACSRIAPPQDISWDS